MVKVQLMQKNLYQLKLKHQVSSLEKVFMNQCKQVLNVLIV